MRSAAASVVDLLRSRVPRSSAVALAAASPGMGVVRWSAGTLPDGRPVTTRTPMYAASITKQFIAALVARAILARQLEPEASVRGLVPALPPWAESMRVRHLVHHTSGLPSAPRLLQALHLTDEAALDNRLVVRALARLAEPDEEPGRVFRYSNTGYVVLAEVLRSATGTDPAALVQTALLAPLGLTRSMVAQKAPYTLDRPPPRTVGDGGLWTTARDLLRWLDALNRGLLGRELTHVLQTPGHLDDGTPLDYAWGMAARATDSGITYTHGGSWPGWTAKAVRNPTAGTAVALLTCHDDDRLVSDVAMAIHRRLALD
jgi:CubicO group peptidase (beta-lactamase class C family)